MRRRLLLAVVGGLFLPVAVSGQGFSQRIDATCAPDDPFIGQFLPARGSRRISAIVNSEVKATAYLDVTTDVLNEDSVVMGAVAAELQPKQAQILALPASFIDIQGVRLRVVNRDRTFGRVTATLNVSR
ncbi:hypothetical protein [Gloeobacter kilaueensis]|uniref:Uncharacterized protein n=1 Tax=Gloeobacter kilaueensis (strain ATCC BAA-2537 / CCAP 1431/1 / ULC 316 / JS1) TaxID=1183438 RepID=U5QR81_GLOK1|nr:hypothetical protein [Gloeobacter kilaueensis]AGY60164.1 hypothetical protein GKIL_3918 [Gloeobacter kilaueensis JS1]